MNGYDFEKSKVIVFGTGNNFVYSCGLIEDKYKIVGLVDNAESRQGTRLFGYMIKRMEDYSRDEYDYVILTPSDSSEIREQLINSGLDSSIVLDLGTALGIYRDKIRIRIAIILYGGMGDFIIAKNWLYLLNRQYEIENEEVYIYCDRNAIETVESLYSDCTWISDIRQISYENSSLVEGDYDIVLRFSIFPYIQTLKDNKVYQGNKGLYEYALRIRHFGLENYEPGFFSTPWFYKTVYKIFSENPGRKYHTQFDVFGNLGASDDYLCEIPLEDDEKYLYDIGLMPKRFITIDTGLNQEYAIKQNVRAWKHEYWDKLARLIKASYPDYKVVQMGLSNGDCEDIYADLNLNGRTNLEQAKILMKTAFLHIDYEGGLVHLRHVLKGGCTIVLMGPTSETIHNYPENIAIRTDVCKNPCEWTGQDWLVNCRKGLSYPKCMESITPEIVMKSVGTYIDEYLKRNEE